MGEGIGPDGVRQDCLPLRRTAAVARTEPRTEPAKTEDEISVPPAGRVRSALRVLRGEAVLPAQIQWEWLEYRLLFDDILKRLSAQLARQAKAEKNRLAALLEQPPAAPSNPDSAPDRKAALRARVSAAGGLAVLKSHPQVAQPEEPA